MKILIVDDEVTVAELVSMILQSEGYETVLAHTEESALEVIKNSDIDLIILDVVIPGSDGMKICREIKSNPRTSNISVIMLTVKKAPEYIKAGLEAGAIDYLSKPFDDIELIARVKSALRLKQKEDELNIKNRELDFLNRKIESQNALLEKTNKELEDFIFIVSHDLQSPLISISGYVSILKENLKDKISDEYITYIDRISANVTTMNTLVKSLLDLSRLNTQKNPYQYIDIKETINEVLVAFYPIIDEKKIKVVSLVESNKIYCDMVRIKNVFFNLIDNAIKYIGENNPSPYIEVGGNKENNLYKFYVKDNGIGIPDEYHEKIFKPMVKVQEIKTRGVGLGLSLVKKIIENHGGSIWVESEKNKGSTFFFTIPVLSEL